ncbi:MAG: DUF2167 domain-containing protein [Betaproteobacteria bacterium]|nr:DUF2167 domain-containing protein [Betaproteobacteria bacterium]
MPNCFMTFARRQLALAALLAALPGFALAEGDKVANEVQAAFDAAKQVMQRGPAEIAFLDQAMLKLPEGLLWVPKPEAARMLRAMGNRPGDDLLGLALQESDDSHGFVVVRYVKSGFVKDDDAKKWDAAELLDNLRSGTEEVNAERRKRGIREVEVVGWIEPPAYNAATQRLIWSLSSKEKGAPAEEEGGVNYNTYALGREGYVSMNLVTGMNSIQTEKSFAHRMLAALEYKDGKRYGDFNAGTDHIAEYGLAALIGGVAAKKLGLIAVALAFLAKFAKIFLVAGIALLGILVKIFRSKKAQQAAESTATPPQP